jgi:hypothetical protein
MPHLIFENIRSSMPISAAQYRQLESSAIDTARYQNREFPIEEIIERFNVTGPKNLQIPLHNICASRLRKLCLDVLDQIPNTQLAYKVTRASWILQKAPLKATIQWSQNKECIGDPSEKQLTFCSAFQNHLPQPGTLTYRYLAEFVKDVEKSQEYPQIDLNNFQWKILIYRSSEEQLTLVAETLIKKGFKVKIDQPYFTLEGVSDSDLELCEQQYICVSVPQEPGIVEPGDRYKRVPSAQQVLEQTKAREKLQKPNTLKPHSLDDVFARMEEQLKYIAQNTPLLRRWGFDVSLLTPEDRKQLVVKLTSIGFAAELDLPTILDDALSQSIMVSLPEEPDTEKNEAKED